MNEIELVIREGEGQFVEFKRSPGDIAPEITAFANASGGRIYIGIDDDGKVPGVAAGNAIKSQVEDIARNCDPPVRISIALHFYNGRHVIEIKVEEGVDKPYQCKGGFYLRQGANSQKMRRNEIASLMMKFHDMSFDNNINAEFNMKHDFDREKLRKYLEIAGLRLNAKADMILSSLGVLRDGKMTNAGVMFFAKTPRDFSGTAYLRAPCLGMRIGLK